MNAQRLETLTDVFRTVFNMPELELRRDLTARDVPGWDSFNHVNLIIQIENEFGVRFSSLEASSLQNVGELLDLLDRKVS